jgi:large subunit ribosomal protein L9
MEVILLERVPKLGQMGDVVRVKDGFARNYLLPKGKALRATEENRAHFQGMKGQLEARNLEQKSEAQKVAEKVNGRKLTVLRQAAEGGQLYGSVSPRDIASLLIEQGFTVTRAQIALHTPIKAIGLHRVPITLHPEVEAMVELTVARNADEAQRIARGEDITALREEAREGASEEAAEESATEAFFEPEVVEAQRARQSETEPAAPEPEPPQKSK